MAQIPFPETDETRAAGVAHQEARNTHAAAVGSLAALRNAIESGDDDVQPAALVEAQALVDHAALRVEAMHRRKAEARRAARTQALATVAQQINAYDPIRAQDAITTQIQTVGSLVNSLLKTLGEHNARVAAWRKQAADLLAEADPRGTLPPAEQAGVCTDGQFGYNGVQLGDKRLGVVDPGQMLVLIAAALHLKPYAPPVVDLSEAGAYVRGLMMRPAPSYGQASDRTTAAHFRDDA